MVTYLDLSTRERTANMMFGSIPGSAVASGAAMGGIMSPLQKKEGYDPAFSAAVNIASAQLDYLFRQVIPLSFIH